MTLLNLSSFPQILPTTFTLKSPTHTIRFLNESLYIAPQDELAVEHVSTFPEGYTLGVRIEYRVGIEVPGDTNLEASFLISEPYSSVVFNSANSG